MSSLPARDEILEGQSEFARKLNRLRDTTPGARLLKGSLPEPLPRVTADEIQGLRDHFAGSDDASKERVKQAKKDRADWKPERFGSHSEMEKARQRWPGEKAKQVRVDIEQGHRGSMMMHLPEQVRGHLKKLFREGDPRAQAKLEELYLAKMKEAGLPAMEEEPSRPIGRRSRLRSQRMISAANSIGPRMPFLSRSCREKSHTGPCGTLCECECHGVPEHAELIC